jgi:membrane fusion protein (multidrug efflux system)
MPAPGLFASQGAPSPAAPDSDPILPSPDDDRVGRTKVVEQPLSDADSQAAVADAETDTNTRRSIGQLLRWPLMIGVPVVVLAVALFFLLTGGKTQATDDAFVQSARTAISPSIAGRVVEIDVRENQVVRKGQVLFKLDDADYRVAVSEAEAAVASARYEAQGSQAVYGQRLADLAAAQETAAYTRREAERQKALAAAGVATQMAAAEAGHAADQAQSQIAVVRQQVVSALADIGGREGLSIEAQPKVLQAQAALMRARLNLSYTTVTAPADGVVTKVEQLQVGSRVAASQQLFWLISGQPWIEANFKEDQLKHMRVGQPATVRIDAYDHDLSAHVASFSPGTGSNFALLPPENSTGNWVKVTQRLPVRLVLDNPPAGLSGGLSAKVTVDITSARGAAKAR